MIRILSKRLATFVMALAISTAAAFAQKVSVKGQITDENGEPMMSVGVMEKGTDNGVISDFDGNYSIQVKQGATLVFSFIGYANQEIKNPRGTVNVVLKEDAELLDEVVVVGYGVQKKGFVVGSVSQTNSEELLKAPQTNVSAMLAGRLAGVTSVQSSGIPGDDAASLLIRGQSTFNNSSPLILVDGVERSMNYLNPNDIESVSVLKDAATAAIYGVRAANGVILVTTKSGQQGASSISYDGSATFNTNTVDPDILDADEYIYWHNKARELDGQSPYWTEERIQSLKDRGLYGETDWWKSIYNDYGFTQQHNISATGGTEKVKYYTSIGYMDQEGIMKNTSMKRYNIRANVDAQLAKGLRYNVNLSATHTDREWPGLSMRSSDGNWQGEFSPLRQAFFACPIIAGTYNGYPLGYNDGTYTYNPVAALATGYQTEKMWMGELRSTLEYDFGKTVRALKGLKASVYMAYNFDYTLDHNMLNAYGIYAYNPNNDVVSYEISQGIPEDNFNKSHSIGYNMTIRPQLNYERDFGKSHVTGLFLFERYNYYGDTMTGYKQGFAEGSPIDIDMGSTDSATPVTGSHYSTGSASFAARIGYAYAMKYILEATMRADGSYKFAPENRWGYFPSVALGWVVSEENFMKGIKWMDYLKLRASAGVLGSDDTDAYLYLQTYYSTAPTASYIINGSPTTTYYTGGYVYDNLTWSNTNTYDFGFETKFLDNRLGFEFDWFYKHTTRILEYASTGTFSPSLGGNYPTWQNSGEVDNRGFDLNISWRDQISKDWNYKISGVLGWSRNKVLKMLISDDHPSYRQILGQPMGTQYGFNALGLFTTQEQLDNYAGAPSGWADLGYIMYEDVNGDGKISSAEDYVKIGRSSTPEMTFSLNFDLGWKQFSLSMLFQGATLCNYSLLGTYANGNLDSTIYTRAFYAGANTMKYLVEDAWSPENPDGQYPRLSAAVNGNDGWDSSFWIKDGSYLRLKNLQLAYDLPKSILGEGAIKGARFYLAGTNLLTFSAFKYIDPENPGINYGYYPQQRSMSIGTNITF